MTFARRGLQGRSRGMALLTALLAIGLMMIVLAVMIELGTSRLRRTTEDLRSLQALAAAQAGVGWVRALFVSDAGDLGGVLTDIAHAHSTLALTVDGSTEATIIVSLQTVAAGPQDDHLDRELQENPRILETPVQVTSTSSLHVHGTVVAVRTVTVLLRTFHHLAPYSEIVGEVDNGGTASVDSPGDAAGQIGASFATDLRLRAYTENPSGQKSPADKFQDDLWSDNNNSSAHGLLP